MINIKKLLEKSQKKEDGIYYEQSRIFRGEITYKTGLSKKFT